MGGWQRTLDDQGVNFWNDRNVLVTGATGLLGSWVIDALARRGANVVALVRDHVPKCRAARSGALERVNQVFGCLEDHDLILRAVNEYEVDTVFHLGAQTIVGTANRSPRSTFEGNIRGTWVVLEACRQCPTLVRRVIVASSDKAYGVHDKLPYDEDAPLVGRFPYDVSKSCADLIALSYFHTYGLPVAITRCGNLYGGGDLNFNRLVPGTIRSVWRDEKPVIRSDGRFIRDYFYVKDAAEAYLLLAERLESDELAGQAFNFGNQTPVSVIELVDRILQLMDRTDLTPVILNQAANEIPEQYLNCTKARRVLDWSPACGLDDGLRETIHWYRAWFEQTRKRCQDDF